jgi:crotonobetainyl-CoA:carnitine CoA-transferase CaiB-like acyl-CoA transferase
LGADVIRVERPKGEDERYLMPVTEHGEGAPFLQCNGGKRCLALEMTSPKGRRVMRRMIAQANVVVANYPRNALTKAFRARLQTLKGIKDDIILATATAYGTECPMAERIGFDGVRHLTDGRVWKTQPCYDRADRFLDLSIPGIRRPGRYRRQDAHWQGRAC